MDEPDWDEEVLGEPDWIFDAAREPDEPDEGGAAGDGRSIAEIREKHRKAYDRWTPQADAKLAAGYLAGKTIDQLAVEFERQPSAIQRRLERVAFAAMTRARTAPTGDP
ncbi:hypothetical protein [Paractinoplanes rishiriensis]|uniref:Uncharacterized protein n=1 Tax=Paractinoplanes rishiriensis TaxID=1050105 RepID=A0A919MZ37_9ACTN|nr:hypothetical protein [Actinoplanes rishiriensis]GIE93307.1 hypothetical protein Ari01nite_07720 [Actinoplanes rishiriensis]